LAALILTLTFPPLNLEKHEKGVPHAFSEKQKLAMDEPFKDRFVGDIEPGSFVETFTALAFGGNISTRS
jgi:hypothetical protein